MRAILTTGDELELAKDCSCNTHDGPHWLHMDEMWKKTNRQLLDKGTDLGMIGFIREEVARLGEKEWNFKIHRIARLCSGHNDSSCSKDV